MKIIFLDIDGVLNRLTESQQFRPDCIDKFNSIIEATDADVVLTSSWRYMTFDQEDCKAPMTLGGFAVMLRTHDVRGLRLVGATEPDEVLGDQAIGVRATLIRRWLQQHPQPHLRYVVIDDCNDGFTDHGMPFVHTDPTLGLTAENADEAIALLSRL